MPRSKIIIIGGGASGIVAGIISAREGAKVTILERMPKIGKKILATGNGRCNLSNKYAAANNFHSESNNIYNSIINQFNIKDTLDLFEELGIKVVEKEDGKLYPRSEQSNSVVSALLYELKRLKVDIICDTDVSDIEIKNNFKVTSKDKAYYCNKLIIATGGKSCPDLGSNGSGYNIAKKIGHSIIEPFPSLIQLKTDFPYLKQIQGTKIWTIIKIIDENNNVLKEEEGELLFTDYGISGPPVLQLSRYASKKLLLNENTYIIIDFVPEYKHIEDIDSELLRRIENSPNKTTQDFLIGFLNNRLIIPILKIAQIDINKKVANLTKDERLSLAATLKNLKMKVTGTHQWNQSQVTAGGVNMKEINQDTLESKLINNIYFCGEILDIDGDCGGYNLQWAWSSGAVAGMNAVN